MLYFKILGIGNAREHVIVIKTDIAISKIKHGIIGTVV